MAEDEDQLGITIKKFQMHKKVQSDRKEFKEIVSRMQTMNQKDAMNIKQSAQISRATTLHQSVNTVDAVSRAASKREQINAEKNAIVNQMKGQVLNIAKESLIQVTTNVLKEDKSVIYEDFSQVKGRVKRMLKYDMSSRKDTLPEEQKQLLKAAKKIQKDNQKVQYIN